MKRGVIHAAVAAVLLAACSPPSSVDVERSNQSVGELRADVDPVIAGTPRTPSPNTPEETSLPAVEAAASDLEWGSCDPFGAPPADVLATSGWECATLSAPMDPFGDTDDAGDVQLALTRHPATGTRRGAIVLNPGGPGGSGLPTAWNVRNGMPSELLRGFDIVSWDPRGVGESTPKIDCDDAVTPGDADFIGRCAEVTGPLSAFLSAPYSAADMEAIRVALGEPELNYLGYSYGSVLGATYAAAHPDTVGAFVLDGVTDPLAGSTGGPFQNGFPSLADDGFDEALERFTELCDATERCLFSLDASTVIEDLAIQVPVFPTSNQSGGPDRVTTEDYDLLIDDSLQNADDWELLATGLGDADRGDASVLAALVARNADFRSDADSDDADSDDADSDETDSDDAMGESDFAEANFMIYCADFGPLVEQWTFCDGIPENVQPLTAVQSIDVERDVLIIGSTYDPLTPGYHAPEFVDALGDATHIIWDGVGHTAFPGWTSCIDDAVTAQFLRTEVPDDGAVCSFLFGVDDDEEIGDIMFGHGDIESLNRLEGSLGRSGADSVQAVCIAEAINQENDRIITHVILDITSDDAGDALDATRTTC